MIIKNLIALLIFTLVLIAVMFGWNSMMPVYSNPHVYWIIIFFFFMNALAFKMISEKLNSENKNAFTLTFLGFTGIKLFVNLFIILIYAIVNKPMLFTFAIMMLTIYLFYTFFEVYLLMKMLKNRQAQS